MTTDPAFRDVWAVRRWTTCGVLTLSVLAAGCAAAPSGEAPVAGGSAGRGESWAVTAWSPEYEIFAEIDPLIAGQVASAYTHVTKLDRFQPVAEGEVRVVLAGAEGRQVFSATEATRPGIFSIEIVPEATGEFDLSFEIASSGNTAEVAAGRVRVGDAATPGGALVLPAPKGASDGGEPLAFLKEQQWRIDFATSWVRTGRLARSVSGVGTLKPPAGGDRILTSPIDGVVQPVSQARGWPHSGLVVSAGDPLLRILPRVAEERSLPSLQADLEVLAAERTAAQARLQRLEELLGLGAASRRAVEEARVHAESLQARTTAAAQDLEAARAARAGTSGGGQLLRAPFAGTIAAVSASPGATVEAGEQLARLVRTDRVWVELALSPSAAQELGSQGLRALLLDDGERPERRIEDSLRVVSVAPELSPRTGTVAVLVETPSIEGLRLQTTVQATAVLAEDREGIVIPATALVDDAGVMVVYLQLSGEQFLRQRVTVLERQGDFVLVERLSPGQRLVDRGGEAIRRSSLMASGAAQGHVH